MPCIVGAGQGGQVGSAVQSPGFVSHINWLSLEMLPHTKLTVRETAPSDLQLAETCSTLAGGNLLCLTTP